MEVHPRTRRNIAKEDTYQPSQRRRGLGQRTVLSYERLLGRLDLLDHDVSDVTQRCVLDDLWTIDNPNTRRAAFIALRSAFDWSIKIPRG